MDVEIENLLKFPNLWDEIVIDELDKKHKGDVPTKEILFLCSIGRLIKNKNPYSFNVLVLDKSSSGKDNCVGSVLKLFPREDYETYGRISAKSLNYLHSLDNEPNYNYNGKIIYLKEITDEILNNEVMKEFTSGEEEISKVAITKQKGGGVNVVEIRGHPCVFTTSATTLPTEEIRNRFNIVKMDLSEEQTARTFIREKEEYSLKMREGLKQLKEFNVEIPKKLFDFIVKVFPKNKVRYRRDFQRLLDFVRAVCVLHQYQRNKQDSETLIAESRDYDIAKDCFMNAFSTSANIPLKDIDDRIVKALEKSEKPLSAKQILNEIGGIIAIQNLYNHLRNLTLIEILNELKDRDVFNNITTNYILSEEFKDKKPLILPNYFE
jgi:hypothetical protein